MTKVYDVFISYASEDMGLATELYQRLQFLGLRVWIDQANLRVGDSVTRKLGEALTSSRFCVLIVSKHYLKTGWAQEEMKLLLNLQFSSGERKILPLWHNITRDDVKGNSPFLVDIKALSTRCMSTDDIAFKILEVARKSVSESEPQFHINKNNVFLFTPDRKTEPALLRRTLRPTKFKQSLPKTVRSFHC